MLGASWSLTPQSEKSWSSEPRKIRWNRDSRYFRTGVLWPLPSCCGISVAFAQIRVRLHCSWLHKRLRLDVSEEDAGCKRRKQWGALDLSLVTLDPLFRKRFCATAAANGLKLGLRHATQAPKTTLAPHSCPIPEQHAAPLRAQLGVEMLCIHC